jgi:hypothetical protein
MAELIHHRRAHYGDEVLFFDENNLQALSAECHNKITGRTVGGTEKNNGSAASPRPLINSAVVSSANRVQEQETLED